MYINFNTIYKSGQVFNVYPDAIPNPSNSFIIEICNGGGSDYELFIARPESALKIRFASLDGYEYNYTHVIDMITAGNIPAVDLAQVCADYDALNASYYRLMARINAARDPEPDAESQTDGAPTLDDMTDAELKAAFNLARNLDRGKAAETIAARRACTLDLE